MALPFVLFENLFALGTLTATDAVAGFPVSNVIDWRQHTADRWKTTSATDDKVIHVDLGASGARAADTFVIAGHVIDAIVATISVQYSDDNAAWFTAAAVSATKVSTGLPAKPCVVPFGLTTAHRYWRFRMSQRTTYSAQVGIVTLGRRLEFTEGVMADLDPYSWERAAEFTRNEKGAFLGVNIEHRVKVFRLSYSAPGLAVSTFFRPVSGLGWDTDFVPHAVHSGRPFWFAWDSTEEPDGVYLCRQRGKLSMPHVGTTARRGLLGEFEAYREVA